MEPARIDWKTVQWVFVEDELYEHINAPKWFDFSATKEDDPADGMDVAWFCRPDCSHPTTADDFLKPDKKSTNAYRTLLLGERNHRDLDIKRRGLGLMPSPTQSNNFVHRSEDGENQNPNLSTPVNHHHHHIRSLKAAIKSSSEKKIPVDVLPRANDAPRLKTTLSARNLFAGRNFLNQITDFVGELKKLALRAKEREENVEKLLNLDDKEKGSAGELSEGKKVEAKERKPLLQVGQGRSDDGPEMSIPKRKHRSIRRVEEEAENIPISLDLENVVPKGENILSHIRTSPPTPQCVSATRQTTKKAPAKETRSRIMERQILQEVKQNSEETPEKGPSSNSDGRETKMLDLFWLLKPCTPSG